jgi:hypothetical protein
MADAEWAVDEARLREIADVTKKYSRLGELGLGLGLVPAVLCWWAAALASWARAPLVALAFGAAIGPLLLVGWSWSRRYYRRHGLVQSGEERRQLGATGGLHFLAVTVWLVVSLLVFFNGLFLVLEVRDGARWREILYFALPFAGALATGVLLWRVRHREGLMGIVPLALLGANRLNTQPGWLSVLMPAFFGFWVAVMAVQMHLAYRRVERRLAALRKAA